MYKKKSHTTKTFTHQPMNILFTLPLEPTLSILKQNLTNNDKHIIIQNIPIKKSTRLSCIVLNQECTNCHIKGNRWHIEQHLKTTDKSKWHINLYCNEPELDHNNILITRDHIIPISKNGPDTIENSQTMCTCCNNKKSAKNNINDIQPSNKMTFTPTIEEIKLLAKMLEDAITQTKLSKNKPIDDNIINSSQIIQYLSTYPPNLGFIRILSEIFLLNIKKITKIKHICQTPFTNLQLLLTQKLNIVPKTTILWRLTINK